MRRAGLPAVYMGDVDTLLEPFVGGMTETEVARRLKPFWRAADRLFPDGFSHVNIGPQDSKVGRCAGGVGWGGVGFCFLCLNTGICFYMYRCGFAHTHALKTVTHELCLFNPI